MFVRRKPASVRSWLDVTWGEIREAERRGEKFMEFELTDIFEEASIYGRDLERLLEENIRYVLQREGLYDPAKMGSIVIPAGALAMRYPGEGEATGSITAQFSVFDKTGNRVIATGTVYGTFVPRDGKVELLSIGVAMTTEDVKKLKSLAERLKASLASLLWR